MKSSKASFNIYIIGVGGQGIGLLSEVVIRAADAAGERAIGVDTHGLAQRGGIVVSHVRVGEGAHSPLVAEGEADLVIALERHEALRAMNEMLGDSATMIWYDAVWQPLDIRLGKAPLVSVQSIEAEAARRGIRLHRVFRDDLEDPRTQNTAVLAKIASKGLIPGVTPEHYRQAMADLMEGGMLERNLALFERLLMGDPPR